MEKKAYMVRFFAKDMVNGEMTNMHEISRLASNKYIPIPVIGSEIVLEDCDNVFVVKSLEYAYPYSDDEEYEYDICVFLEVAV